MQEMFHRLQRPQRLPETAKGYTCAPWASRWPAVSPFEPSGS